jgi:UDP-hydrolysing UDP-N-acetyl-D-glucosamine 2-epimerase
LNQHLTIQSKKKNQGKRSIGVVTVGRTDWAIWKPVLEEIRKDPSLELRLYVTGSHLSPEFGMTVSDVLEDGFEPAERVEVLISSDSPQGVAKAMGLGLLEFAQVFSRSAPDVLLVLGDRFETFAAVSAAMSFKIPVAHLHGGESTEGAIDQLIRHAVTKMSHIHFPATQEYAERIIGMGEESWRVNVSGAPGVDSMVATSPLGLSEFAKTYGVDHQQPFLLVTYHPVTLEYEDTDLQVREVLSALEQSGLQMIITFPNSDTSGRRVLSLLESFVDTHSNAKLISSMGRIGYASGMRHAAAMVGNSSSGIIEAASFELPVVNVGNRQRGRTKPANIIDVGYGADEILMGIQRAVSPSFRDSLKGIDNPYGSGNAARKIVGTLRNIALDQRLIVKVAA